MAQRSRPGPKRTGGAHSSNPEDGETQMTTETQTNSVLNTVKEAFAPVTEAFKNLQNMEVPEAAREFVKKTAGTAKERAGDLHAGSEKVTAAMEPAITGADSEAAKISRNIQQAIYQDTEAFFAGI